MKLAIDYSKPIEKRSLSYLVDECSFDMNPIAFKVDFELALNKIALLVTDGQVVHLSGFSGYNEWQPFSALVPDCRRGVLLVHFANYQRGVSYSLAEDVSTFVNMNTGWICIGDHKRKGECAEFITGCRVVLEGGKLASLWLKPDALPNIE